MYIDFNPNNLYLNPKENDSLNDFINSNISLIENQNVKELTNQNLFDQGNTITNLNNNEKNLDDNIDNSIKNLINPLISNQNNLYINLLTNSPRNKTNNHKNRFFLTNVNRTPSKDNSNPKRLGLNLNLRNTGNNILNRYKFNINNNLTNSPKRFNQNKIEFPNYNKNINNFTSTYKTKQTLSNANNTNNFKQTMLTSLPLNKTKLLNLSDGKNIKKVTFTKNKTHEKNFKIKNSLDLNDFSIIKHSPENELRINLTNKKKNSKQIKSLDKLLDKKEHIFNKIYSFNTEFVKLIKKEQNKDYQNLEEYQGRIVQLVADKISKDNLRKLTQKLKTVRDISECCNDVNKINWKLFDRVIHDTRDKIKGIKDGNYGSDSDCLKASDNFIKDLNLNKKKHVNLNKKVTKFETSIKRISPFIPEYLVEKFKKCLKIVN